MFRLPLPTSPNTPNWRYAFGLLFGIAAPGGALADPGVVVSSARLEYFGSPLPQVVQSSGQVIINWQDFTDDTADRVVVPVSAGGTTWPTNLTPLTDQGVSSIFSSTNQAGSAPSPGVTFVTSATVVEVDTAIRPDFWGKVVLKVLSAIGLEPGTADRLRGWDGSVDDIATADMSVPAAGMVWDDLNRTSSTKVLGGLVDVLGNQSSARVLDVAPGGEMVGLSQERTDAFIWSTASGYETLGHLEGGTHSIATGISASGAVVVGASRIEDDRLWSGDAPGAVGPLPEAFRWTRNQGMVGLGQLPSVAYQCGYQSSNEECNAEGIGSWATATNADGSVIVGAGRVRNDYRLAIGDLENWLSVEAFRWDADSGMVALGDLPGGRIQSIANAVNGDGSVIVGSGYSEQGIEAFRWNAQQGMVGLGDLPGGAFHSVATGVSDDGSVVVGFSQAYESADLTAFDAFRWGEGEGMVSLRDWLVQTGATLADDFRFGMATGVSADGQSVSGTDGENLWTAVAGRGVVGPQQALASASEANLVAFGAYGALSSLALNGAHHRPLLADATLAGDNCAWLSGDGARYEDQDASAALLEIGGCADVGEGLRLGVGLGRSRLDQGLPLGGESELDGRYLYAELDYLADGRPWLLSVSLMAGEWDADIDRGYLNAGVADKSFGTTDFSSRSLKLRLDWLDAAEIGGFSVTPKIEYSLTRSERAAYTETGGGFPAHFNAQSETSRVARIGFSAARQLDADTAMHVLAEAAHRFEASGAAVTGEFPGLFSFQLPGADIRRNWARLGLELDHRLSDVGWVSASVMASTDGPDPDLAGALGFRMGF